MQDKISKPERYPNYEAQLSMLSQKRYQDHQCQHQPTADSGYHISAPDATKPMTKPMAIPYEDTRWMLGVWLFLFCGVEYGGTHMALSNLAKFYANRDDIISWCASCI